MKCSLVEAGASGPIGTADSSQLLFLSSLTHSLEVCSSQLIHSSRAYRHSLSSRRSSLPRIAPNSTISPPPTISTSRRHSVSSAYIIRNVKGSLPFGLPEGNQLQRLEDGLQVDNPLAQLHNWVPTVVHLLDVALTQVGWHLLLKPVSNLKDRLVSK